MTLLEKAKAIAGDNNIIDIFSCPNLLGSTFHHAYEKDSLYDTVVWSGTPEKLIEENPVFIDHIVKYWAEDEDTHDEEVTVEELIEEAYIVFNG